MTIPKTRSRIGGWRIALTMVGALSFAACEMKAPAHDPDASYPQVTSDSGCVCTYPPSDGVLLRALVSLSCVCGAPGRPCPNYDSAVSACMSPHSPDLLFETTYSGCNLISVAFEGGFTHYQSVYDATTHELVGSSSGSDVGTLDPCGKHVGSVVAGVLPVHCQATSTRKFCP
jgi:hypothetical protein